ncbi:MAG TPA: polymer-forming cytoskeletal protein [Vicinamibacterales bacterium]|jgi:cytoskeletal protein CcmA (bactofilin family)|nr:polymer-forming cytoskeletal protein [Vicinamibacterales bacterium]
MSSGIGKSIRIKGDVVAREPFLIAGRVEGTIAVDQHTLTIAPEATVNAAITAESVVIEGTVEGDLAAINKIVIQTTANVEGECSAPIISIADGAIVQGKIETTQRKSKLAVAS